MAGEPHAIRDAVCASLPLQGRKIGVLGGTLRAAHDPAVPRGHIAQLAECVDQDVLPFPRLQPADLDDDHFFRGCVELSPELATPRRLCGRGSESG